MSSKKNYGEVRPLYKIDGIILEQIQGYSKPASSFLMKENNLRNTKGRND